MSLRNREVINKIDKDINTIGLELIIIGWEVLSPNSTDLKALNGFKTRAKFLVDENMGNGVISF